MDAGRLQNLVDRFLEGIETCNCSSELDIFDGVEIEKSVKMACRSSFGGRRHPHQRRLKFDVFEKSEELLINSIELIRIVRTFDELHEFICGKFKPVRGAGELYAYDVSHRIGRSLGLRPAYVYLHAGTRKGAKHFNVTRSRALLTEFPDPIASRLTPEQAEDFLCIYKGHFAPRAAPAGQSQLEI